MNESFFPMSEYNIITMDPHFYNNLFTIPTQTLSSALKGGAIIAIASTIYYFLFGSALGMSGLTGSLIKYPSSTSISTT